MMNLFHNVVVILVRIMPSVLKNLDPLNANVKTVGQENSVKSIEMIAPRSLAKTVGYVEIWLMDLAVIVLAVTKEIIVRLILTNVLPILVDNMEGKFH